MPQQKQWSTISVKKSIKEEFEKKITNRFGISNGEGIQLFIEVSDQLIENIDDEDTINIKQDPNVTIKSLILQMDNGKKQFITTSDIELDSVLIQGEKIKNTTSPSPLRFSSVIDQDIHCPVCGNTITTQQFSDLLGQININDGYLNTYETTCDQCKTKANEFTAIATPQGDNPSKQKLQETVLTWSGAILINEISSESKFNETFSLYETILGDKWIPTPQTWISTSPNGVSLSYEDYMNRFMHQYLYTVATNNIANVITVSPEEKEHNGWSVIVVFVENPSKQFVNTIERHTSNWDNEMITISSEESVVTIDFSESLQQVS